MHDHAAVRRIGAYGGTFDPIHVGHIEIAQAVVRNFGLDQLLIIPAYAPPHKRADSISEPYHRYTMAVLASLEEPKIRVSAMEIDEPDRRYTFETIERLQNEHGSGVELFFVMGADSFEELATWREPKRLLAGASVIVTARPGYDVRVDHDLVRDELVDLRGGQMPDRSGVGTKRIFLTDWVDQPVSSTEIRRRVREGKSISQLVPARVAEYITRYELYRR